MVKRIAFHGQARRSLKDGIDVLAGAVKYTLGPRGQDAILRLTRGLESLP